MSQAGSITSSSGGDSSLRFDGDSGTAVPVGNTIEMFGDGTIVTSAAGNTVTFTFDSSGTPAIPTSITTDSGTVTPVANVFSVIGAAGISTMGSGSVLTITGTATGIVDHVTDSGTATPAGNVLNVQGGTGVSTSGAGNTLTITADVAVPTSFATDSGTATPAANVLSILGGTGASTSGSGSTVTVAASADVATSYPTDSGTATPAANALTLSGGTGLNTSGSGATATFNLDVPVLVSSGGTGGTSLTDGGIMLGSGVGAVTVTSQPTNGQLLIGSTGVDPVLATLTAPAAGIAITEGPGSISFTLSDDLSALEGLSGTGMVARTAADTYALRTITGGTGITVTNGDGVAAAPDVALTSPVVETLGGTGTTTYATGDILYSDSANSLAKLGIGAESEVLTVSSGVPAWAAAAGGGGGDWTLITTVDTSSGGAKQVTSGLGTAYEEYYIYCDDIQVTGAGDGFAFSLSDDGGSTYAVEMVGHEIDDTTVSARETTSFEPDILSETDWRIIIHWTANKITAAKEFSIISSQAGGSGRIETFWGRIDTENDIDAVEFDPLNAWNGGSIKIYGR